MTRTDMVLKVAYARGFEDRYTLLIGHYAEDMIMTDRELKQMMYDILLGVGYGEEEEI